jgi:hypothetical protein
MVVRHFRRCDQLPKKTKIQCSSLYLPCVYLAQLKTYNLFCFGSWDLHIRALIFNLASIFREPFLSSKQGDPAAINAEPQCLESFENNNIGNCLQKNLRIEMVTIFSFGEWPY